MLSTGDDTNDTLCQDSPMIMSCLDDLNKLLSRCYITAHTHTHAHEDIQL